MSRYKYLKKIKTNQKGISIIEVVVSFYLISIGLVGVLALVTQSMQVQYVDRNKLIASQLAQECQEILRNKRDSNWFAQREFYYGIADQFEASKNYIVTIDNSDLIPVADINDPLTKLHICHCASGDYEKIYTHDCTTMANCSMGPATIFSRIVTTQYNIASLSIDVLCNVEWQDRNRKQNYITSGILYNWGGSQ